MIQSILIIILSGCITALSLDVIALNKRISNIRKDLFELEDKVNDNLSDFKYYKEDYVNLRLLQKKIEGLEDYLKVKSYGVPARPPKLKYKKK